MLDSSHPETSNAKPQHTTRRGFYIAAINAMGAILGAAVALPAAAYLLIRPKGGSEDAMAEVGELSQLQPGVPKEVLYERKRVDGWRKITEKASTWLVKTGDNTVVAFNPSCTHLGCAYHWETSSKEFVCPCHASVFSVEGKVVSGPAPRPLDRYVAKVRDGKILIGDSGVVQG